MTEKVLQEFRIIETDDGFRIEIKGDKEQLRDWVMGLDPRGMERGPGFGPGGRMPFGPSWMMRGRRRFGRRFGPPWMWAEGDDEEATDDEEARSKRKRGQGRGRGRGRGHGGHGEHHGHGPHDVDTDTDEA